MKTRKLDLGKIVWKTFTIATLVFIPLAANAQVEKLQQGLDLLFKNAKCQEAKYCPSAENNKIMIQNALEFQARLQNLVGSNQAPEVHWYQAKGRVREFEFPSAFQRSGDVAINTVHGFLYLPNNYEQCDELKYPATLIMHELADNLDSVRQISAITAGLGKGVAMVIYMPHFGPRKDGQAFITKDVEAFEDNVLQTLADIHQSQLILKNLKGVQSDNIGLMGLSLGAMMSLISAGIDPIFDRYATNVGGGDLANIMTYRKTGDVDSQTGKALKDIDWTVDQARFFVSRFDAITWSPFVHNKKIVMINANSDELINRSMSIDPLIAGFRAAGSHVQLIMHKGTHVFRAKEVGLWSTAKNVFYPTVKFVGEKAPASDICSQNE